MGRIKLAKTVGGALALALMLGAPTVDAASKKNTTKASVGVVALCALSDDSSTPALKVDLNFTDQSSGDGDAIVRSWTVQAIQKDKGNWDDFTLVGPMRAGGPVELNPDASVAVTDIPLCGNEYPARDLTAGAKAVNINATIVYGSSDPICDDPPPGEFYEELCKDRTIYMNCSPNPERDGQGGVSVADISCGE